MNIGIIGTGIISSAIVTGFCEKKLHRFFLSPRNAEKAAALAAKYGNVTVAASNQEAVDNAEWVVVSVLPKDALPVYRSLTFSARHKVINVAANCALPAIRAAIGETAALCHVVPLPFIREGYGPLAVYPECAEARELFSPVGRVVTLGDTRQVAVWQALTSLMSPFNALLHEVVSFAVDNGMEKAEAISLTASFFESLSIQAASFPEGDLKKLSREMTPGGLNEQALTELEKSGALRAWYDVLTPILKRVS